MSDNARPHFGDGGDSHRVRDPAELVAAVRRYFETQVRLREGIRLVNASRFEEAARKFSAVAAGDANSSSLSVCVATALTGVGGGVDAKASGRAEVQNPDDVESLVRDALAMWKTGRAGEAIARLRQGIEQNREAAELHYQLGTLLAAADTMDEADGCYRRAVVLDPDHADALVGLAMCEGVRQETGKAVRHLTRAQQLRPGDARINLLLSMAARAAQQQGQPIAVRAATPQPPARDAEAIEELSRVIETEPDFVDAFLSLPAGDVEEELFALLAETLHTVLRRQPEHADLYYHCSRVLVRLGRRKEAIELTERAVRIDPKFVKALIQLGRLYGQTNRLADATARLEQAIEQGAEYPDVYLLLGNLYRDRGQPDRARWAFDKALGINEQFLAARAARASLTIAEQDSIA